MPRSLPVGPVMHDEAEPIHSVRSCPRVLLEEVVWLELDSLLPDSVRKVLRPVLLSLLEMLRAILQDDLERWVLLVQHPENVQRNGALPSTDVDKSSVGREGLPGVVGLEGREIDIP